MKTIDDFIKAVAVTSMGGIVWNPLLHPLLPQDGDEAKKVQDEIMRSVSDSIRSTISLFALNLSGVLRISPEEWRVECERAAFHAGKLLRLARITSGTATATVELILTAPRTENGLEWMPETVFFVRVMLDAQRFSREERDQEELRSAIDYFTTHLPALSLERRRLLEASLAGTFMGWLMP